MQDVTYVTNLAMLPLYAVVCVFIKANRRLGVVVGGLVWGMDVFRDRCGGLCCVQCTAAQNL